MIAKSEKVKVFLRNPLKGQAAWLQDGLFRKLVKNSGWLMGGQVMVAVLGVLSTVIKARSLGAQSFGVLSVILAYMAVVAAFCTFQPWQALIKFGAEALAEKRPADFVGYVKLSLALDAAGSILGAAISLAAPFALARWMGWSHETTVMMMLTGGGLLFSFSGTPTGVLRVLDNFKAFTVQQTATAVLGFAGTVAVYLTGGKVLAFLVLTLVCTVLGNFMLLGLAWWAMRSRGLGKYWRAPMPDRRPFLRFAGWTYVSSTLDIPAKQFDILIVGALTSLEGAGIYKVLKQIVQIFSLLTDGLYQAVYPQFAAMVASRQARKTVKYAMKVGILIVSVVAPVSIGLGITSPWWLGRVFGLGFAIGWLPLCVFLATKIFTLPTMPIHPLFVAAGYVRENTKILLAANSAYLLLAWVLTVHFGIMGIIVAGFVQTGLIVAPKVVYLKKYYARGA